MFDDLRFSVHSHWEVGGRGRIAAEGVEQIMEFSAPVEFHGEPGFWTPEQFLLAGVASCFATTFRSIAGYSKFEPVALDISVEGRLSKGPNGFDFTSVVIRPQLTIREEADRPRACRLLEKTERACIVARALKCPVTMEARVDFPGSALGCEPVGVSSAR